LRSVPSAWLAALASSSPVVSIGPALSAALKLT
jgi:hypothetical protein